MRIPAGKSHADKCVVGATRRITSFSRKQESRPRHWVNKIPQAVYNCNVTIKKVKFHTSQQSLLQSRPIQISLIVCHNVRYSSILFPNENYSSLFLMRRLYHSNQLFFSQTGTVNNYDFACCMRCQKVSRFISQLKINRPNINRNLTTIRFNR